MYWGLIAPQPDFQPLMLVAGTLSEHLFWCQVSADGNFCRKFPLTYKSLQAVRVLTIKLPLSQCSWGLEGLLKRALRYHRKQ